MKDYWKFRFRGTYRIAPAISEPSRGSVNANDLLTNLMGSFGKYQFNLYILVILTKFIIAFHQFAIIFLAPRLSFTCPEVNGNSTNTTTLENNKCPCLNPKYESKIFSKNIITEWNLICDDKWMVGFTQTLFQFGNLLGSSIFGSMSDRCGRRLPMVVASLGMLSFGAGSAYMPTYWTFTAMRFVLGTCVGGTLVLGFVIIMEFIGDKHRELFSALYQLPFNIGHVILPVIAYFYTDYRKFQLTISLAAVVLILYIFFLPESPRWLLAVNRTEGCIQIVEKVAKINKLPVQFIRSQISEFKATKKAKKGTCLDLFRNPNLRKNFIIVALTWTTTSYCFYGVSQFVGTLGGNVFINVEISASVTLLGCFLSILFMKFLGRRTIIIFMNIICSVCLLVMAFFNENIIGVILATIGTVSSFIAFVVVYLYTSELFPTVVRSAAVGNSSMMARLGSMIAPFVVLLEDVNPWITPVLFGVPPFITACLLFLLPETKGIGLLTTLEEGERFGSKKKVRLTVVKNPSEHIIKEIDSIEHKIEGTKIDETKGILKIEEPKLEDNSELKDTKTGGRENKPDKEDSRESEITKILKTDSFIASNSKSNNKDASKPKLDDDTFIPEPESDDTFSLEPKSNDEIISQPQSHDEVSSEPNSDDKVISEPKANDLLSLEPNLDENAQPQSDNKKSSESKLDDKDSSQTK